ncbi:MAG: hypothetical protein IT376_17885 [Polyangiaceae bacterium]|nr:hypothetical protein [Polyangiaceae bacterium]
MPDRADATQSGDAPSSTRLVWVAVALAVITMAVWRAWLVGRGPDPDTDAYGHHVIARQLLVEPGNHGVHWVWLPLFHWLQVPLAWAGGSMQVVRWVNVALWSAAPLLLAWHQRRSGAGAPASTIALGAALVALAPIGMQMGTTAQPEPLFALLVLGFAHAMQARRFGWAAALLSAAVLTRYEAWAVLAATGAWLGWRALRRRTLAPIDGAGLGPLLVLAAPAAAILVWAWLRVPADGRWFGFLGETKKFANEALGARSALEVGAQATLEAIVYYPVTMAARVWGPVAVLVPFGIPRVIRRHPWLAATGGACLAFVTWSWIMRSSLGLDRHFVVLLPLYGAFVAAGVEAIAERAGAWARSERARRRAGLALACAALAGTGWWLERWMGHWRGAIEGGLRDRVETGAFLRTLPARGVIFCDEATVEVLSGLEGGRFERRPMPAAQLERRVLEAARRDGVAHVATWGSKLEPLAAHGELIFRPPNVDPRWGLGVLRVVAPAGEPTR